VEDVSLLAVINTVTKQHAACIPGMVPLHGPHCSAQHPVLSASVLALFCPAPNVCPAGSLLEQAENLIDMGIHPLRIAEGYEMACKVGTAHLETIATKWDFDPKDIEPLVQTCMTTLSSKV
jgi:hypothetical protein